MTINGIITLDFIKWMLNMKQLLKMAHYNLKSAMNYLIMINSTINERPTHDL